MTSAHRGLPEEPAGSNGILPMLPRADLFQTNESLDNHEAHAVLDTAEYDFT